MSELQKRPVAFRIPDHDGWIILHNEEAAMIEAGHRGVAYQGLYVRDGEIERLRAALDRCMVGGNHIATYRTDKWPDYGATHDLAMTVLGPGREYDMWCCWNAIMQARDSVNQQERDKT